MSEKNANIVHEFDNFMKNFCMIAFGLVLIVLAIVILLTFFILWIDFTGWLFQVITRLVKSARTVLIDIWKCFLFLCDFDDGIKSAQMCSICNFPMNKLSQYCRKCRLYVCLHCEYIYEKISACKDHQEFASESASTDSGSDEMKTLTVQLEEDRHEDFVVKILHNFITQQVVPHIKLVSFTNIRRAEVLCFYNRNYDNGFLETLCLKRMDDLKPDYFLRSKLGLVYYPLKICLAPRSTSGFSLIIHEENILHFVPLYIPLQARLKNIFKMISCQKVTYELHKDTTKSIKYVAVDETICRKVLLTEFNNGIALLLLKDSTNFGRVRTLSITFYSPEGAETHKCFLKKSSEGKLALQSPVCMTGTFNNTLVICESNYEIDRVIEVDTDGNIIKEVDLTKQIEGMINSVTCDVNGNIYVAGYLKIVQISERGNLVKECLSLKKDSKYKSIVDIMYSENNKQLYVVFDKREITNLEKLFSFVSFNLIHS
ncbi:uncharacterized protein LOC132759225 [Ruditapes philippinarum]|uniref:uncharacterized protein LOC132759225 n=1 Tax=Ruditapes philippinarum TaxID=129788 RepID=UPI00295B1CB8|nr:uncharacterized protein LOC132759225 [Ruditapes philippinarum]